MKIKRALISVYDKTGVIPLAKELAHWGVEIISTGGTASLLRKEGIHVTEVASVTKFPEMLSGRIKTLHPNLHAGLLALRNNEEHLRTLAEHNIKPIDLLVVNLYPFWDAVKTKSFEHEIIDMIDIGGPAMLRSASKNFESVAAVSDPADYNMILSEIREVGFIKEATMRALAGKVFRLTSYYDGLIADYFEAKKDGSGALPSKIGFSFEKKFDLRYGENPHQKGSLYQEKGKRASGVVAAHQLHGKELSFNNILDLDLALEMVEAFEEPACAIIKHVSPCGFASAKDITTAFKNAYVCDSLSAFGSIIGLNRTVEVKTAKAILASGFVECLIAPGFEKQALELLKTKKNLRLLTTQIEHGNKELDFKKVKSGLLVQERDTLDVTESNLKCVTKLAPKKNQITDLLFAFKVCRYVKSNAIVIVKNRATIGLGMGQPSRVDSCITAFHKAGKRSKGAVLASDGFFPKADSIALAEKHGISVIIQPGGSIQDKEVIQACDRAKIAMVNTGVRHFKH